MRQLLLTEGFLPLDRTTAIQVRKVTIKLLPDRLRKLLEDREMSLTDLAHWLGVSDGTVGNWLADPAAPGWRAMGSTQAVRIGELLEADLDEFCLVETAR